MKKFFFFVLAILVIMAGFSPTPALAKRDREWWVTTNLVVNAIGQHSRDRQRAKAQQRNEEGKTRREQIKQEAETERLRIRTEAELEKERIRRGIKNMPAPEPLPRPNLKVSPMPAMDNNEEQEVVIISFQILCDKSVSVYQGKKMIGNFETLGDAQMAVIAFYANSGVALQFKIIGN